MDVRGSRTWWPFTGGSVIAVAALVAASAVGSAGSTVRSADAGTLIAFVVQGEPGYPPLSPDVAVISPSGSGRRVVTRNHASIFPAWSPDGRRIAFSFSHEDARGGLTELGIVDVSGKNETILTDGEHISEPAWEPGSQIAVDTRTDSAKQPDIWSYDPRSPGRRVRLTTALGMDTYAVWSPQGNILAYAGSGNATLGGTSQLYTVTRDGRRRQQLTRGDSGITGPVTWSPDGRRIAFAKWGGGTYALYVIDLSSKRQRRITRSRLIDIAPQWSPDGGRILFERDMDGNINTQDDQDIWAVNPDGSRPVNLTRSPGKDVYPTWSPDGSKIAFGTWRDGNAEIYVMNRDGSGVRNLTRTRTLSETHPVWSPR